jgi:4-amino-4-deoxy-L-arabinose transferase-like glycosyltransferase
MQFNQLKKISIPFFLIVLTLLTRFCFLNWGNGFFFNPDENNMATSVFQMTLKNLNPNFFAYGQFPLFLTFFTTLHHNFSSIILTLRFWSAVFSSLSIYFFYLIAKDIFSSKKIGYIFSLLLIFTPGLIQSAHFGTTESILIFVFSVNIFLSFKYLQHQKLSYLFLSSLISGIGLASKITALFFILPILLSLLFIILKTKSKKIFLIYTSIFLFLTLIFSFIFSPFNIIDFSNFKSSISYETSVATGQLQVFYTRQFENSTPYLFQFKNIFPYTNGIIIFIFSFIGFLFFLKNKFNQKLLLIFIPSIIYFIYTGQLFVKWSRFMSPLFFIEPFFCLFLIKKIKNIFLNSLLIFLMIFPGIYFFRAYFPKDIRVIASNWVNSNLPSNSFVLSESGNIVNLPLSNSNLNVDNFDFYQLDSNKNLQKDLSQKIILANYIFVPSRRVFKNENNNNYPISQKYYQNLFSHQLGFSLIKTFSYNRAFLLTDENAEETWSVFDNPTIRIYQKDLNFNQNNIKNIF